MSSDSKISVNFQQWVVSVVFLYRPSVLMSGRSCQMSYYGQNWIILNVGAIISRSTQMSGSTDVGETIEMSHLLIGISFSGWLGWWCVRGVWGCEEGRDCECVLQTSSLIADCGVGALLISSRSCHLQLQLRGSSCLVSRRSGPLESNSDCQLGLRMTDGPGDGHCSLGRPPQWQRNGKHL